MAFLVSHHWLGAGFAHVLFSAITLQNIYIFNKVPNNKLSQYYLKQYFY